MQNYVISRKKTGGTDQIAAHELTAAGEMLFEGLYSIYHRSILNSIYPDNWKIAKVLAAFKKGVKSDMANYRPLSMLNLNSKVLESIVSGTVDKHLSKVGSLHPHQWGFKKGQSTETLLLYMTETWKDALDKGYKVGVIFVDFKKAIDTTDHEILKFKLQAAGLSGDVHNWLVN